MPDEEVGVVPNEKVLGLAAAAAGAGGCEPPNEKSPALAVELDADDDDVAPNENNAGLAVVAGTAGVDEVTGGAKNVDGAALPDVTLAVCDALLTGGNENNPVEGLAGSSFDAADEADNPKEKPAASFAPSAV